MRVTTRVAGVDLGVTDAGQADDVAARLARHVEAQGASAAGVVVGVHRILLLDGQAGATGHLAFSLRADDLDEERLWEAVGSAAADLSGEAEAGVVLGRRRSGPPVLSHCADTAAGEQREAVSGRAVAYRGDDLCGALVVADALDRSVIEEVHDLAGGTPALDDLVLLRNAPRPRWQFGSLVLHVLPAPGADGSVFVPVETMRAASLAS